MHARTADVPDAVIGAGSEIAPDPRPPVTETLATFVAQLDDSAITPAASQWARHALLDWFALVIAARDEPLVRILTETYGSGAGPSQIIAAGRTANIHDAALINGAAGHALDYDDVNPLMGGHPTVPVAPVVIALGQALRLSGRAVVRAFVAGYEAQCQLGTLCIPSHYLHGFHATGTLGTFGAAAAAASLLNLDKHQTAHALGMAAAQAAGLKSMFGTMTKPLHAGKAAMNGVMAAQLAARGFTANPTGVECEQGFAATQVPDFIPSALTIDISQGFAVESNLFKYHAACYLTHSCIEAILILREQHRIGLDDMSKMELHVADGHRAVCDIAEPATGLEIKFSIRHLTCMALDRVDTARLDTYSDANAINPRYVAARKKVQLVTTEQPHSRDAVVRIHTNDGRLLEQAFDVAIPADDVSAQWDKLTLKARAIAEPVIGPAGCDELIAHIDSLDSADNLDKLLQATQ